MNLTDLDVLEKLLKKHGLTASKRWGQHFLIDAGVVKKIVDAAGNAAGVLEVGPGPGVLTQRLPGVVIAVEIDPIAVSALGESAPDVEVVAGDALRMDLGELALRLPEPRALVSNMPYNITGPLLGRFSDIRAHFECLVLMMQREVGEKICAKSGDSSFGALSLMMQLCFSIEKVCDVPPSCFAPPPKVQSIVLKFVPRVELDQQDEHCFSKFVHKGFKNPRKTLINNLQAVVGREAITTYLVKAEMSETIRPHQIDLAGWLALWRHFPMQN